MVFTYDPTRLDIPTNQIRLRLGADGMDPTIFQDEELKYFLEISKGSVNWALYYCYMTLATRYSQSMGDTLKIGDVTISENSNKSQYYLTLANQLKSDLLDGNLPDDVESTYIYVGGIHAGDTAMTDVLQAEGVYTQSFSNQLKYNTQKTYCKYPERYIQNLDYNTEDDINNLNYDDYNE